jgi:hypothetical protein
MASTRRRSTEVEDKVEEPNDTPGGRADLPAITSSTLACPGGTIHGTRLTSRYAMVIGQHLSTNTEAGAIHSRQTSIT